MNIENAVIGLMFISYGIFGLYVDYKTYTVRKITGQRAAIDLVIEFLERHKKDKDGLNYKAAIKKLKEKKTNE